jgi:lauroyl/myristoyl acyltransferase
VKQLLQDKTTEFAYAAGWATLRWIPEPITGRAFDALASEVLRRDGGGVAQLRANLIQVRPEDGAGLVNDAVRSYLRYWHEAFRLQTWSRDRISNTFTLERVERLDEAMDAGRGAVMVPGHMGNWDHAGAWAALRYGHVVSVAERLKPKALFDQFLNFRRSLGMRIYGFGDADIMRTLVREVRDGNLVALLGDRDLGGSGVPVEFCGAPTTLPGGPAMLSLLTGAPLYPVSMWFDGAELRGRVLDRVEPPEGIPRSEQMAVMTQAIADALGAGIREHPVDWHMMQRVWPEVRG